MTDTLFVQLTLALTFVLLLAVGIVGAAIGRWRAR